MKADLGKSRVDLIPPDVLIAVGRVLDFGQAKYKERGWEAGFEHGRAYAAALRHLMAYAMGEDIDPESGLPHLDHATTNCMFLSAFQKRGIGTDDRSPHFLKAHLTAPVAPAFVAPSEATITVAPARPAAPAIAPVAPVVAVAMPPPSYTDALAQAMQPQPPVVGPVPPPVPPGMLPK